MSEEKRPFSERRTEARSRVRELHRQQTEDGKGLGFFDAVYKAAKGDAAAVPWADLEPHPGLAEWIGRSGNLYEGKALDVACGLGDNAEALSHLGYQVTAFDLSNTAVEWAKERFSETAVNYLQADLFNLPEEWAGAFDLVHETYTLQSLPAEIRANAMRIIANCVAPGSLLLVICRSKTEGVETDGPPWPLAKSELGLFTEIGLAEKNFQEFVVREEREIPHFRIEFERSR
ncbi:MAG: class I SAM-dependent methyltransferase [Hyphomicrobiales bacterium]